MSGPTDIKFLVSVLNFLILVGLLYFVLRKKVPEFFRSRATQTKLLLEEARKSYEEACHTYEAIEAKLKNADAEGRGLIAAIKEEAEAEKLTVLQRAKEMAEKIKTDSERLAEQEVKKARVSLQREATLLSVELAEGLIKKSINTGDQKKLSQDFVSRVKTMGWGKL